MPPKLFAPRCRFQIACTLARNAHLELDDRSHVMVIIIHQSGDGKGIARKNSSFRTLCENADHGRITTSHHGIYRTIMHHAPVVIVQKDLFYSPPQRWSVCTMCLQGIRAIRVHGTPRNHASPVNYISRLAFYLDLTSDRRPGPSSICSLRYPDVPSSGWDQGTSRATAACVQMERCCVLFALCALR
eukprot:6192462-Pleurochrysis_carterae.AAC.2